MDYKLWINIRLVVLNERLVKLLGAALLNSYPDVLLKFLKHCVP